MHCCKFLPTDPLHAVEKVKSLGPGPAYCITPMDEQQAMADRIENAPHFAHHLLCSRLIREWPTYVFLCVRPLSLHGVVFFTGLHHQARKIYITTEDRLLSSVYTLLWLATIFLAYFWLFHSFYTSLASMLCFHSAV